MIYFGAYLIIGLFFLLAITLFHQYEKRKNKLEVNELYESITAQWERKKSWSDYVLEFLLVPLIAITSVVFAWPAFLVWRIKEKWWSGSGQASEEEKEFEVTHDNIQQRLTIEEIETKRLISDPLNAVPGLPFGHLNTAWVKFKDGLQSGDEMWSFTASWTKWGHTTRHEGYAILRGDELGPWFTADVRQVDSSEK